MFTDRERDPEIFRYIYLAKRFVLEQKSQDTSGNGKDNKLRFPTV